VSLEGVALIPSCVECGSVWLPADEERWRADHGGDDLDEPAELSSTARSALNGSSAAPEDRSGDPVPIPGYLA
jgi:hypothetical protein